MKKYLILISIMLSGVGFNAVMYFYKTYDSNSEKPNDHIVDTNEMVSSQTERMYSEEEVKSAFKKGFYRWNEPIELSDEKITKLANEHILYNDSKRQWVVEGMKLYREQLKTK